MAAADADDKHRRAQRLVKLGIYVTCTLFVIAIVMFIASIMTSVGALAGVGGVLLAPTLFAGIATGIYYEEHSNRFWD